jgi:type VII secretion protein EccE
MNSFSVRLAGRVAVWQLALLGAVFATAAPTVPRAAALAVCALALVFSATRVRGRWLDQWLRVRLGFGRRVRERATLRFATPLDAVAAGFDIRSYTNRAGNKVGLLTDGTSWVAVLRVEIPPQAEHAELQTRLRTLLDRLVAAFADGDVRIAATQLVTWSVPAVGGGAWRLHWAAVRFVPRACPAAVEARGGGEHGAQRAAAAAALRLAASLRQAGFPVRVLDNAEVRSELSTALGVDQRTLEGAPPDGHRPTETWVSWSIGALHHVSYRLRRPARHRGVLASALTWLARPPALATCVSVLFQRADAGPPRAQVAVRVAVPADRTKRAVRSALRQATKELGVHAVPMNGAHALGVQATIPLCGAVGS